ncbi:LamG domain-containing protein [Candidatus Nanosalina sp. VS9-1]|uniref:LamG domain-containing protein n=1 Tax=Candidatus Nanosalina sp. VS9-1 TaxID=3388566 RepID=UPI0039E1D9F1
MTLVGYWPLNEESGDKAYDHSGNENHGTINDGGDSTVPEASGILGQNAYSFDGSNDYVEISLNRDLWKANTLSISLWIKPVNLNAEQDYFSRVKNWGSESQFKLGQSGNGDLQFAAKDENGDTRITEQSSKQLKTDRWNHVTANFDGAKGEIYVNSSKIPLSQDNTYNGLKNISSTNMRIGSRVNDSFYSKGKISEVRIYNRPLTESEIQYLYNVGKRGLQTTSKKTS